MHLAEERAPNGITNVEDVISRGELDAIAVSFAKAAGLDVDAANYRPSYISQQEQRPDVGF